MKQHSAACEQNRDPILSVLKQVLVAPGILLEIGSGSGQHAAWMPAFLPHIRWQPSDLTENLPSIRAWCDEAALPNVLPALELDVTAAVWPIDRVDYVYSANTAHIMPWRAVELMIKGIAARLAPGGAFCLYGPFNYHGQYTSVSNLRFDQWLRQYDPQSAIRDVAQLQPLAESHGLVLKSDVEMPVNNRLLHWERI